MSEKFNNGKKIGNGQDLNSPSPTLTGQIRIKPTCEEIRVKEKRDVCGH